jgi:hypothetical protein
MGDQTAEMYREFTGWATWVYVLVWGATVGAVLPAMLDGDGGAWLAPDRLGLLMLMVAMAGAIQLLFGGLLVTVHRDGVKVGLGRGRIFRTFIPFSDVVATEVVTYKPLREFGGWGLRGSRQKRAWTARGDRAVVLQTRDERRIYIGSDNPEKLEARIRTAMSMAPGARTAEAP